MAHIRSLCWVVAAAAAFVAPMLVACGGSTQDDGLDPGSEAQGDEQDLTKTGGVGATCDAKHKCQANLVCGIEGADGKKGGGPPPGAMGLPLIAKCYKPAPPAPGELGGKCTTKQHCDSGLKCVFKAQSPSDDGRPVMGMPLLEGTCVKAGGPPPGAMGLPIQP